MDLEASAEFAYRRRLLVSAPGGGRADLDDYADDIARVSLAATPFIETYLTSVMAQTRPARVLDVGCGTGVYARIVAGLSLQVRVDGIDLAPAVIDAARAEVRAAGLDGRIRLQAGDVRTWTRRPAPAMTSYCCSTTSITSGARSGSRCTADSAAC